MRYQIVSEEEEPILLGKTLNLEPDKVYHYLKLFSEWISSQKHLPQNINQICRKKFLVWAKLDMEKAKNKFVRYCYITLTHKDFVSDRIVTLEGDLKSLQAMNFVPMPKLTPDNCRVTISKVVDADRFDILEMCRLLALAYDFFLHVDSLNGGIIMVLDMKPFKSHHYSKLFNITYFRFIRFHFQNFPFRVHKVLIVNLHPYLVKGLNICLMLFPEKLRNRTLILNDSSDLLKHIAPEYLPSEYGGVERPTSQLVEDFTELLLDNADLLRRVGQTTPIGPVPNEFRLENEFGVEGSFRKLNID